MFSLAVIVIAVGTVVLEAAEGMRSVSNSEINLFTEG